MFLGFMISFCATFALMIATLVKLIRTCDGFGFHVRASVHTYCFCLLSWNTVYFPGAHVRLDPHRNGDKGSVGISGKYQYNILHNQEPVYEACFQMIFEVFVLIAVCLNAFARPRVQNCEVKLALMRDGIGFFGVSLPSLNLYIILY